MKILALAASILLFVSFASAQKSVRVSETPAQFAARVARAFEAKRLGSLATPGKRVKVMIEHSLGEGRDAREARTFGNLTNAQAWITKKMISEARFQSGKLTRCRKGRCGFAQNGMLHNHLYLTDFTYGTAGGKYFLKTLSLLDGD